MKKNQEPLSVPQAFDRPPIKHYRYIAERDARKGRIRKDEAVEIIKILEEAIRRIKGYYPPYLGG